MAVEILILSGARQGARLVLDGKQLRVGTEPGCEVFFDPQHDPSVKDRAALLQLEDDGWHIRSTGTGDLMVNQRTVAGSRPLRSGDVVRLSAIGPDFCFRLMASGAEMPKKSLDFPGVPAGSPLAVLPQAEAKPLKVIGASPTAALASSPAPVAPIAASHWTKWVSAGLGACAVAAVLWRVLQPPPSASLATQLYVRMFPPGAKVFLGGELLGTSNGLFVVPTGPAGITVDLDGHNRETRQIEIQPEQITRVEIQLQKQPIPPEPATTVVPATLVVTPSTVVTPPPPPPSESPLVQLCDAVFLLEVEKAGRFWPFATCVAVGRETLLTSAREAMQLAAWRENEGFKLWAVNLALGIKKEIHEIRLHGIFATLAEKPNAAWACVFP